MLLPTSVRLARLFLLSLASLCLLFVTANAASSLSTVATVCTPSIVCPASPTPVPAAWYNLTFATQPTTSTTPTYGWEASDAGDASCPFQHSGIATFNASLYQFVNLTEANPAAAAYGGGVLPGFVGGPSAGSLAAGTAGWSFEATYRLDSSAGFGSVLSMGAAMPNDAIALNPGSFTAYDSGASNPSNSGHLNSVSFSTSYPYISTPYQWQHIVVVLQQVTNNNLTNGAGNATHGAWFIYVNGVLLNSTGGTQANILPSQVPRAALLGKSIWATNPFFSGLIDTFRIYNVALSQSQVTTLYGGEMGGCAVPVTTASYVPAPAYPNLLPRTANYTVSPIYSLTFDTNPLTTVSGASGYGWNLTLASDSAANQAMHRGLLTLNGSLYQFVDLNAASGAHSVGQVLPIIGGGTAGWSFECMFLAVNAKTWTKLYDLGTGPTVRDDILFGWSVPGSAPDAFWQFDVLNGNSNEYRIDDSLGQVALNTWTHAVAVIAPSGNSGLANYLTYVNGQLYTTANNVYYPAAVARPSAYLGRSNWNDPLWNGAIDFFNIYSQALSDVQVASLYLAAITPSNTTTPSTGSAVGRSSSSSSSSSSSGSSVRGGSSSMSSSLSSSGSSGVAPSSSSRASSISSAISSSGSSSSTGLGSTSARAASSTSVGSFSSSSSSVATVSSSSVGPATSVSVPSTARSGGLTSASSSSSGSMTASSSSAAYASSSTSSSLYSSTFAPSTTAPTSAPSTSPPNPTSAFSHTSTSSTAPPSSTSTFGCTSSTAAVTPTTFASSSTGSSSSSSGAAAVYDDGLSHSSGSHGLSSAAIAGIAIGGAVAVAVLSALCFFLACSKPRAEKTAKSVKVERKAGTYAEQNYSTSSSVSSSASGTSSAASSTRLEELELGERTSSMSLAFSASPTWARSMRQ